MAGSIEHPELVIRNANIITIDPRRPRAQALAVQNGRFVAVGDDDSVGRLAGPDTRVLNLGGQDGAAGFHRRPHSCSKQRHPTRHGAPTVHWAPSVQSRRLCG